MIKTYSHNFKRKGKVIIGRITNTEFFEHKDIFGQPNSGRGLSKYRSYNDKFLLLSTNYPKLTYIRTKGTDDYVISLHLWGKDKAKDNIEIKREFPTLKMAKEFMNFIN